MAHSVLTPMLLELLRLAASDGDVSAWGRTQREEGSEPAFASSATSQRLLEKPGSRSLAVWQGTVREGCKESVWKLSVLE